MEINFKKKQWTAIGLFVLSLSFILSFQNCGQAGTSSSVQADADTMTDFNGSVKTGTFAVARSPAATPAMSLPSLVASMISVDQKISSQPFSAPAKKILLSQKTFYANIIAIKTLSGSCQELLGYTPALTSGTYYFYQNRDEDRRVAIFCDIKAGKLISQLLLN